jgi:hypothetical protein
MPLPGSMVAGRVPVTPGVHAPSASAQAPAGGAAPPGPTSFEIPFTMQTQGQAHWCWAATETSVSLFYDPMTSWTQCSLANQVLPLRHGIDCCQDPSVPECDTDWHLDSALRATSNLRRVRPGVVSRSHLKSLMAASSPLCARIGWAGGSGHFVVLHGYKETSAGEFVDVADPNSISSTVLYNDLVARYRSAGAWTHFYWTEP